MIKNCFLNSILITCLFFSHNVFGMSKVGDPIVFEKINGEICFKILTKDHVKYKINKLLNVSVYQFRGKKLWSLKNNKEISENENHLFKWNQDSCLIYGRNLQGEKSKNVKPLKVNISYQIYLTLSGERVVSQRFYGDFCLKKDGKIISPYFDKNKNKMICEPKPSWWKRIFHW